MSKQYVVLVNGIQDSAHEQDLTAAKRAEERARRNSPGLPVEIAYQAPLLQLLNEIFGDWKVSRTK